MPTITTFLTFNDRAEEAVNFYTSVFSNSRIVSTTRYGDSGPGPKGSLMTATFELEGQEFIALNGGPSFSFSQGISVLVSCETQDEVDELPGAALGRRRAGAVWLAHGQVRPVVAGRSAPPR